MMNKIEPFVERHINSPGPYGALPPSSTSLGKSRLVKEIGSFSDLDDTDLFGAREDLGISASYAKFARRTIANIEIINLYCAEVINSPYEENIQTDLVVGRWLDQTIPSLSQELYPLLGEMARFHIDTSILDIYKNLLIFIGQRYKTIVRILVLSLHHTGSQRH